jgi:hypothetical protein
MPLVGDVQGQGCDQIREDHPSRDVVISKSATYFEASQNLYFILFLFRKYMSD